MSDSKNIKIYNFFSEPGRTSYSIVGEPIMEAEIFGLNPKLFVDEKGLIERLELTGEYSEDIETRAFQLRQMRKENAYN